MLTDRPPSTAALRARFLESDRLTALDIPNDDRLQRGSGPPGKAARPRACAKHVQSFYRWHLVSPKFARQGSECLQPARCEFARVVRRSSCLGTTIPKPYR